MIMLKKLLIFVLQYAYPLQLYITFFNGHAIRLWCLDMLLCGCGARRPGEESDANSSRETSTDGDSECGTYRVANDTQGSWSQKNTSGQGYRKHAGRNNPSTESSVDGDDISNPPGLLIFEYFERELPFHREPLADKASNLVS